MQLPEYRASKGLSLGDCVEPLGLSSKGYLSDLETGRQAWPIRLALEVETWSKGQVTALELLAAAQPAEAKLLREAIARGLPAPQPAEA